MLSHFLSSSLWLLMATSLLTCASPASAQWLQYPTAGVPKAKDGKPDLLAPAPRLSGKPDFSGIWVSSKTLAPAACPEGGCLQQMPLPPEGRNIAVNVQGGLPFTTETAALMDRRRQEQSKFDQHVRCAPPMFPRGWSFPQYKKIVQTPALMVMLHEFQASFRQVFLDGRPLPKVVQPQWNGYSVGRWEGDTLVIESIGFKDDTWLDMLGTPLSDEAKVVERIRRPNFGTLDVEVTVTDLKTYTKPWTVKLQQSIVLDTEILEEICTDNERDLIHLTGGKP
jgi:hypothetical protein